jgi:large subunit ribosomal protein L23
MKNPYEIVQSRYITEKAKVLEGLKDRESNRSLRACRSPKYVFLVHPGANKIEIARAVEEIYGRDKVKVVAVNTVRIHPKRRSVRGRVGMKPGFKKAIVTLREGDQIGDKV